MTPPSSSSFAEYIFSRRGIFFIAVFIALLIDSKQGLNVDFDSFTLLMLLLLTATILLFRHSYSRSSLFLALLAVALIPSATSEIFSSQISMGDATYAISNGAYLGSSPGWPSKVWLSAVVLTAIVGLIPLFYVSKSTPQEGFECISTINDMDKGTSFSRRSLFLVVLVYTLVTMPNLIDRLGQLEARSFEVAWDPNQINTWLAFQSYGYVPMKDFWMPYGGLTYLMDGLIGSLFVWFFLVIGLVVCLKLIRRLVGDSSSNWELDVIVAALYLSISVTVNDDVRLIRYTLTSLFLAYALTAKDSRKSQILSSIPICLIIPLSPEVGVFSLLVLISAFVFLNIISRMGALNKAWGLVFPFTTAAVLFCIQAANGSLKGTLHMLLHPSETAQYIYFPNVSLDFSKLSDSTTSAITLTAAVLPFALLLIGLWWIANKNQQKDLNQSHSVGIILVTTGLVSLFLNQKNMMRGTMTDQVYTAALPLIIALIVTAYRWKSSTCYFVSITLVALLTLQAGVVEKVARGYLDIPHKIESNLNSITDSRSRALFWSSDWNAVASQSPTNFEIKQAISFLGLPIENSYVLGDIPGFYASSKSKPYWAITSYNTSPISFQEQIVEDLVTRSPQVVVFDHSEQTLGFDQTPTALRISSVFSYIIGNYEFKSTLGEVDILIRKSNPSSGSLDLSYWTSRLGPELTLGHLLQSASSTESLDVCEPKELNCETFLSTSVGNAGDGALDIICSDQVFKVSYFSAPQDRNISTSRMWFWNDSCRISEESLNSGWQIRHFVLDPLKFL